MRAGEVEPIHQLRSLTRRQGVVRVRAARSRRWPLFEELVGWGARSAYGDLDAQRSDAMLRVPIKTCARRSVRSRSPSASAAPPRSGVTKTPLRATAACAHGSRPSPARACRRTALNARRHGAPPRAPAAAPRSRPGGACMKTTSSSGATQTAGARETPALRARDASRSRRTRWARCSGGWHASRTCSASIRTPTGRGRARMPDDFACARRCSVWCAHAALSRRTPSAWRFRDLAALRRREAHRRVLTSRCSTARP